LEGAAPNRWVAAFAGERTLKRPPTRHSPSVKLPAPSRESIFPHPAPPAISFYSNSLFRWRSPTWDKPSTLIMKRPIRLLFRRDAFQGYQKIGDGEAALAFAALPAKQYDGQMVSGKGNLQP